MTTPVEVQQVVEEAARANPSDIMEATRVAEAAIRDLPVFRQFVSTLITQAVRDLIYDFRHATNVKTKRETGYYTETTQRRTAASSQEVLAVYQSVYDYHINGTTLGDLMGNELANIAMQEEAIAKGHLFNSAMASWLASVVPADRKVRDVISERKLRTNFDRIFRETKAMPA